MSKAITLEIRPPPFQRRRESAIVQANGIAVRILGSLLCAVTFVTVSAHVSIEAAPDCTCRFQGRDIQLGQSVCIDTASGPRMARCVNVLNNTSWEVTERTCPFARAPAGGNSAPSTIAHAGAPAVGRARNRQD